MGQITIEKNVAGIEGLCVITPAVHGDNRGYFMETYSQRDMEEAGININFVQDNQSMSTKGVLRGLHFQKHFPQTKLVRAIMTYCISKVSIQPHTCRQCDRIICPERHNKGCQCRGQCGSCEDSSAVHS